jgi:hypothetical protein
MPGAEEFFWLTDAYVELTIVIVLAWMKPRWLLELFGNHPAKSRKIAAFDFCPELVV